VDAVPRVGGRRLVGAKEAVSDARVDHNLVVDAGLAQRDGSLSVEPRSVRSP
jgi:hypothetical protein